MATKKKNHFVKETTTTIDKDTGEHLSSEIIVRKRVSAEEFLQVYLDDFGALMGVKGEAEFKIILWIGKNMNYETNEIILVMPIKKRIVSETELSLHTINNAIFSLTKKGIMIRIDDSIYMLSPKMFFKGRIEDRLKLIRTMEYLIVSNDVVGVEDVDSE